MRAKLALLLTLALGAALVLAASASAQSERHPIRAHRPTPFRASYAVALEGAAGERLRVFRHRGNTFVLGQLGARYAIRLFNRTDRRVEAVVSVDGRDAISGREADFVQHRGYVVPAHGSVLVRGFRQSLDRVAQFRFSRPGRSYSSRMGTPENVGVVGVAFFRERRPRRLVIPRRRLESDRQPAKRERPASRRPGASGCDRGDCGWGDEERRRHNLGTEYGESRWSPVREVPFVRASSTRPTLVRRVYYDDVEGLEARGIEVFPTYHPDPPWRPEPEPFPGRRFAPPPPGW